MFVNYDMDAPSFLDSHPEIAAEKDKVGMDFSEDGYTLTHSTQHSVESNWKVWYDNFVECYHCDNIHRGTFAAAYEADPAKVNTQFLDTFMSSQFAPKDRGSKTILQAGNYRSFNIFPGLLMLQHNDLMILSQMRPIGPETTEQRVDYFAQKGTSPERVQEWIELWEATFAEDGMAVSMQQKGLRTHALERNRLLPDREEAVKFFNSLVVKSYIAHKG